MRHALSVLQITTDDTVPEDPMEGGMGIRCIQMEID